MPEITSIELNEKNNIRVDFVLPKTNDCIIEFELLEKYKDKDEYLPNSIKYTYKKKSLEHDHFEFDNPIILKHNIEYQVKAVIKKNCSHELKSREALFKPYHYELNHAIPGII